MKVRLLFVIENKAFAGGERGFSQIINGLPSAKYQIFLASRPSEEFQNTLDKNQVHFLPLTFSKRISFSSILRLAKIIRHQKINIVHGQGARAEFYARLATRLVGGSSYLSTIQMPVEGFNVGSLRKKFYSFFDRFSERFVDRFLVVSDSLRQTIIKEHGIPAEKVIRIYNGIEIEHYSPREENASREEMRHEFSAGEDTLLIGAIGRLVWQKGFEYLIRAIPNILEISPRTKLLLVGQGALRQELEELAEKLKVKEHIIFTGFRSDIKEILSAIDVLVVPSLLEGFPMITLEGMAMAKPIIATRIDGITEQIIDGESGILVPSRNSNALADGILRLIRDKAVAQNLGREARKRLEKEFTVEKMIAETQKVYLSLQQQC